MIAKRNHINYNGDFIQVDHPALQASNRGYQYGDGFFETIRCNGTVPLHFDLHMERIERAFKVFEFDKGPTFSREYLSLQITRTLNKNRFFKASKVRLSFYRDSEGLYTPTGNRWGFVIYPTILEHETYTINRTGLLTDIYPTMAKQINMFSSLKNSAAMLYVKAGLYKKTMNIDDCIILNDKGYVCETISSNIFVVKDDAIVTPSLKEGCVAGIMRHIIIKLMQKLGYNISVVDGLFVEDLIDADEIFITNSIQGIQWVGGFNDKRYDYKLANQIIYELNQYTFKGIFL